jgi:hypothetical protein
MPEQQEDQSLYQQLFNARSKSSPSLNAEYLLIYQTTTQRLELAVHAIIGQDNSLNLLAFILTL